MYVWVMSQIWLKSQIWLMTHHILPNLGKSCWLGGMRSNVSVGWFFLCKVTDNCKILTFSLRKISDSTLTQAVSSWLNSDSNDNQRDSTLTRLISWIFTADSTLTRLIWVRVESHLTHGSWVEHNPDSESSLCGLSTLSFKTNNKYTEPRQELIRAEPSFEPSPALSHEPRGEPSTDPMIVGCLFLLDVHTYNTTSYC